MAYSMRLFAAVFLLAMFVMATESICARKTRRKQGDKYSLVIIRQGYNEMGPMTIVEARTCESLSHRFKGPCVRVKNCAAVCETEGFSGGNCRGLRRRCFCTRPC